MTQTTQPPPGQLADALRRALAQLDEVERGLRQSIGDPGLAPPPLTADEFEAKLPFRIGFDVVTAESRIALSEAPHVELTRWSMKHVMVHDLNTSGTPRQHALLRALRELLTRRLEAPFGFRRRPVLAVTQGWTLHLPGPCQIEDFGPEPMEAYETRRRRVAARITMGDAARACGLDVVQWSALETGKAEVDDWHGLWAAAGLPSSW